MKFLVSQEHIKRQLAGIHDGINWALQVLGWHGKGAAVWHYHSVFCAFPYEECRAVIHTHRAMGGCGIL